MIYTFETPPPTDDAEKVEGYFKYALSKINELAKRNPYLAAKAKEHGDEFIDKLIEKFKADPKNDPVRLRTEAVRLDDVVAALYSAMMNETNFSYFVRKASTALLSLPGFVYEDIEEDRSKRKVLNELGIKTLGLRAAKGSTEANAIISSAMTLWLSSNSQVRLLMDDFTWGMILTREIGPPLISEISVPRFEGESKPYKVLRYPWNVGAQINIDNAIVQTSSKDKGIVEIPELTWALGPCQGRRAWWRGVLTNLKITTLIPDDTFGTLPFLPWWCHAICEHGQSIRNRDTKGWTLRIQSTRVFEQNYKARDTEVIGCAYPLFWNGQPAAYKYRWKIANRFADPSKPWATWAPYYIGRRGRENDIYDIMARGGSRSGILGHFPVVNVNELGYDSISILAHFRAILWGNILAALGELKATPTWASAALDELGAELHFLYYPESGEQDSPDAADSLDLFKAGEQYPLSYSLSQLFNTKNHFNYERSASLFNSDHHVPPFDSNKGNI